MADRHPQVRTIGVREQLALMKLFHPGFTCYVKRGLLVCRGPVRPIAINREYLTRIEYRAKKSPKTWIEKPKLKRRRSDESVPHTYGPDEPCLYFPGSGEWRSDKMLADTIIPWLSMWLFYYEAWLATGEWQGGGIHPPRPKGVMETNGDDKHEGHV